MGKNIWILNNTVTVHKEEIWLHGYEIYHQNPGWVWSLRYIKIYQLQPTKMVAVQVDGLIEQWNYQYIHLLLQKST